MRGAGRGPWTTPLPAPSDTKSDTKKPGTFALGLDDGLRACQRVGVLTRPSPVSIGHLHQRWMPWLVIQAERHREMPEITWEPSLPLPEMKLSRLILPLAAAWRRPSVKDAGGQKAFHAGIVGLHLSPAFLMASRNSRVIWREGW